MEGAEIKGFERYFHLLVRRISTSRRISKENKTAIMTFIREQEALEKSRSTQTKYLAVAEKLGLYAARKKFKDLCKEDIVDFLNKECKDKTPKTNSVTKMNLKYFYKWLFNGKMPDCVSWFSSTPMNAKKIMLPEELLTEDELKRLILGSGSLRDQTLISVLYESGCRAAEIIGLKIKHVTRDNIGYLITVSGKTGMRRLRLVDSMPYLNQYLEAHPFKNDPEAPFWLSDKGVNMGLRYSGLHKILRRAAKNSHISKRVNPHSFRHASLTKLGRSPFFNEFQLKEYAGWTLDSKMSAIYIHGAGSEDAKLRMHGIKKDQAEDVNELKPVTCRFCRTASPPTNLFCANKECGRPITEEGFERYETSQQQKEDNMKAIVRELVEEIIGEKVAKDKEIEVVEV